ncbi:hypothetical protein F8568_044815 [Actinomadura sp. LD22]|uniref:Uncharacterized protein n=1 Tax=Actinomadura physcomitrii TaxID=2650748 RepID=A0A6I4MNN2_9ACTN|nr:hypothetical protein [Actinomadura physcomitrii]MWA07333.1 hypothetical protein [Actinomadura physcomitrii]
MRPTAQRTRFADKREDIVPRTLHDLIAADTAQRQGEEGRRHRRRRIMTARRVT